MEESRRDVKPGRVSFRTSRPLPSPTNERLKKGGVSKALEKYKEESRSSACYHPLEIPKDPHEAMEFLSRTWSPSSSDFFHTLSSNNLVPRLECDGPEENDGGLEQEKEKDMVQCRRGTRMRMDHIWTWLAKGKHSPSLQSSLMNVGYMMKTLLGGELLGSLSRGCRRKRKEELRLHVAQVHAALSVARLAAALTGIVANGTLDPAKYNNTTSGGEWNKMSSVVASAAALVATVCAEAAESVGAHRAQVASVINSGLATQTSTDIHMLTATAATCLRGAATLELRAATTRFASEDHEVLARGSQLHVCTPAGKIQLRKVWIYLKHDKLTLRLGKRYLSGALTTYKEYRILDAMEGGGCTKDMNGFYLMNLSTTGGAIRVLFQDEKQYGVWKSTISHLLCNH